MKKKKNNKKPLNELFNDEYALLEAANEYGEDALIDSIHHFIDLDHQAKRVSTFAAYQGGLRLIIHRESTGYYRDKDWAPYAKTVFPDLSDSKRQRWMRLADNLRGFVFPTVFNIAQRTLLDLIPYIDEPRIDDFLLKFNICTEFDPKDSARGRQLSKETRILLKKLKSNPIHAERPRNIADLPASRKPLSWHDIPPVDINQLDPSIGPEHEDYIDPVEEEGFTKALEMLNWLERHLPDEGYYHSHYLMCSFWELERSLTTLSQRFNSVHGKRHKFSVKKDKDPLYFTLK